MIPAAVLVAAAAVPAVVHAAAVAIRAVVRAAAAAAAVIPEATATRTIHSQPARREGDRAEQINLRMNRPHG